LEHGRGEVLGRKSTPILINLASIEHSGRVKMQQFLLGYFQKIYCVGKSGKFKRTVAMVNTYSFDWFLHIPVASFEDIYSEKDPLNIPRAKQPADVRWSL
jgi:hypothetical protein